MSTSQMEDCSNGTSIELKQKAKHWKDNLAGWHTWIIRFPQCLICGKKKVSTTLVGTKSDAKRHANDPELHICDGCS